MKKSCAAKLDRHASPFAPPRLIYNETKVAKLKHMLEVKAAELAGTDMVMVHDLLVLTNDFLSDKNRADEERSKGGSSGGESLFQKMLTEEQRQRDRRVRGMCDARG